MKRKHAAACSENDNKDGIIMCDWVTQSHVIERAQKCFQDWC